MKSYIGTLLLLLVSASCATSKTQSADVVPPAPAKEGGSVTAETEHYRFVATRLLFNAEYDFKVEVFSKATKEGVPIKNFKKVDIYWSKPKLKQAWVPQPETNHSFLFKMGRAKYCWDGPFVVTVNEAKKKAESASLTLSTLCESGN